ATSGEPVREIEIMRELGIRRAILIPAERALTVRLDDRELVTLMTLGASPELLVLGFLCNQRLVTHAAELESISVDWQTSTAVVKSRSGRRDEPAHLPRIVAGGSGQGSVVARLMSRLDTIRL